MTGEWILFEVEGVEYALPKAVVQQTLTAPAGLRGEVPYQGVLYRILDLRQLFALTPSPASECQVVLVELGGERLALVADRLGGVRELDPASGVALPWTYGGRERLWFSSLLLGEDERITVLVEPRGLLASGRTLAAVSSANPVPTQDRRG